MLSVFEPLTEFINETPRSSFIQRYTASCKTSLPWVHRCCLIPKTMSMTPYRASSWGQIMRHLFILPHIILKQNQIYPVLFYTRYGFRMAWDSLHKYIHGIEIFKDDENQKREHRAEARNKISVWNTCCQGMLKWPAPSSECNFSSAPRSLTSYPLVWENHTRLRLCRACVGPH